MTKTELREHERYLREVGMYDLERERAASSSSAAAASSSSSSPATAPATAADSAVDLNGEPLDPNRRSIYDLDCVIDSWGRQVYVESVDPYTQRKKVWYIIGQNERLKRFERHDLYIDVKQFGKTVYLPVSENDGENGGENDSVTVTSAAAIVESAELIKI